ncbi:MAG: methylenetetrahydrofolate reductase [NAD(P)H] [Christensenellaceae bacterium]
MKIIDILHGERPSLSFEVFPPKTSDVFESVRHATEEIALVAPSFMSVTYGAGGGTSDYTVEIAKNLQSMGVTALAHLSCVSSTRERVRDQLDLLRASGIENILALRGDIPKDFTGKLDYSYASELVREIREYGGFCIGGACYPEGHPESATWMEDIAHLKEKVDLGCEFLTTQMFFDNDIYYNFLYRVREAGIKVPVIAGIMPVTNAKSIKRICSISGTALPRRFLRIIDKYQDNPAALSQAGIAFATEQIVDLFANGVRAVHVYSMNKPEVAKKILANLSELI